MSNFKEVLRESGITLKSDDELNIITQEQSLVIRDMEKSITIHVNYPNNIANFITGLKNLCEDESQFQKALTATYLRKSNDTLKDNHIEQDSLFRIILNVNCLQTEVIDILLDQLTTIISKTSEDTNQLRMILHVLRYLPYIKEPLQLTTKILDALEIATPAEQLEMMGYIPDIIPDNQCDVAAIQLSKILEDSDALAGDIIDCLNALNLSINARANIQNYIITRLLTSKRYYKIFPILFEFVVTDCKADDLGLILHKCRVTLNLIIEAETSLEMGAIKGAVIKKIHYLLCVRKHLYDGLINLICSIKSSAEHKPIDLIILFMLFNVCKSKKKSIELIIKRRIKGGLFKVGLFELALHKCVGQQILDAYFASIIEIGSNLLRQNTAIASTIFKGLFLNDLGTYTQRHEILFNLIMLTNDAKNGGQVLGILWDLIDEVALKKHTQTLMGLLDKLDNFNLANIKKLFEIVCRLTCGEDAGELHFGLKDELMILIRKQIASTRKEIKSRGIIAAVVMAKYVAKQDVDESPDVTYAHINELPQGGAIEAATLLNLANSAVRSLPEMMGLYYDQIASMLVSIEVFNKAFMSWLFETITRDFQDVFIVQSVPEPINGVVLSAQYSINTLEELDETICVNIAGFSMQTQSNIQILSPLFRLLRILHQKQYKGDLSSIDALEGCAVIMPQIADFNTLQSDQIKQICDCLFHCINWFREIISAFVTQTNKTIRNKIITRLKNLIELEAQLDEAMAQVPEHKLPISYFDANVTQFVQNTTKKPHKRLKSNAVINDTIASTSASIKSNQTQPPSNKRTQNYNTNYKFRDIDVDVIILLKYPLSINTLDTSTTTTIDLKQFQFILRDFITKLNALTASKNQLGLSHLNVVNPINLITDCRKLIPNVNKQTKAIVDCINELLIGVDGRYDLPELFTPEANDLKLGLALSLQFSALIFGWVGFLDEKNLSLLQDCLRGFRDSQSTQAFASVYRYIIEYSNNLYTYIDQCLYLASAVSVVDILQALCKIHPVPELRKLIAVASEKFLKKRWYNASGVLESGTKAYAMIDVLIKAYLGNAKIKNLCGIVGTLQEQASDLKTKSDYLQMLGSIDKATLHVLYRGLCVALAKQVQAEVASLTNNEHLILWRTTTLTMQGLMTIAKIHETKTNLCCFLKNSIIILKTFLSHGIPILELMLKSKPDQVTEILKILQNNTRFLHHLCCYSKVSKDAGLINLVPQFRLTLETLVYRVKAALAANNCSQAFWMGNLKNRDLQGDDILTQSTVLSETEDDANDELPPDVDSDEEINDSASQVFEN